MFWRTCVLCCICLFLITDKTTAQGVLIYKKANHQSDSFATIVEYKNFKKFSAVTKFTLANGARLELTKFNWHMVVAIRSMDGFDIIDKDTVAVLKKTKADYESALKRFSKLKGVLSKPLADVNLCLSNWSAGKVRYDGDWMTQAEYLDMKSQKQQAELAAEKRARKEEATARRDAKMAKERKISLLAQKEVEDRLARLTNRKLKLVEAKFRIKQDISDVKMKIGEQTKSYEKAYHRLTVEAESFK